MERRSPALLVAPRLDGWERQWDQLVDAAPLPSPFLRSWWLEGTAGHHGVFVLAVEDHRLVGGLALDESRSFGLPSYSMMGSRGHLCPDHLDLVVAPGREDATVRALRTWLGRPGARLFDLRGVRSGSYLEVALPPPARRLPDVSAPWVQLGGGPDAYLDGLTSQFRRQVRRASKRLEAAGATHRVNRGQSVVRSLETLRRLHQVQWGTRSQFLPDFDRFAAACRLGAEVDEVAVHELATDREVVATVVALEVAGRVSLYQSARRVDERWRDATSVLLTTVIADGAARGFTEVDLLRGEESYKAKYATSRRQMARWLAGHGMAAKLVAASTAMAAEAQRVAERRARTLQARLRSSR